MAEPDLQAVLASIDRSGEETRRHFDVVAESLHGDLRLLAEGIGGLSERVTSEFASVRTEIAAEFGEVRAMIKFSYSDLDRRLTGLETTVETLQQRVARIESSLAH
jgi:uncharacterized protein YceH (UPF0502 family)